MAAPFGGGSSSSLSSFSSQSTPSSYPQLAVATSSLSASAVATATTTSPSPSKESPSYSPSVLCRRGHEINQEIVNRTSEIFQFLRTMVLPNGANVSFQQFHDRKAKLDEPCRLLDQLFRKLRFVYEKVNEASPPTSLESQPVEALLTFCETDSGAEQQQKSTFDEPRSDDERELIEQIERRNRQLKEIIDRQRNIVWEINSMMTARRTLAP